MQTTDTAPVQTVDGTIAIATSRAPAYDRHRHDQISWDVRHLLAEAVETAVPFGNEGAREQARAAVAEINDLLDGFLPV